MSYPGQVLIPLLLLLLVSINASNHQIARLDKQLKQLKGKCEKESCSHIRILDEAQNCINECVSKECYREIYSNEPLEDGEIDKIRERQFIQCVRKEFKVNVSCCRISYYTLVSSSMPIEGWRWL